MINQQEIVIVPGLDAAISNAAHNLTHILIDNKLDPTDQESIQKTLDGYHWQIGSPPEEKYINPTKAMNTKAAELAQDLLRNYKQPTLLNKDEWLWSSYLGKLAWVGSITIMGFEFFNDMGLHPILTAFASSPLIVGSYKVVDCIDKEIENTKSIVNNFQEQLKNAFYANLKSES
jgi:hypothetical protein